MALAAVRRSIFGLVVQLRRGGICYIGGSETLPPPLTREEELAYMRKWPRMTHGARHAH